MAIASGIVAAATDTSASGAAVARQPHPQPNVMHPAIVLRDGNGVSVLASGAPVSPMRTCGSCHDVTFIAQHDMHGSFPGAWPDPARAPAIRGILDAGGMTGLSAQEWLAEYGGLDPGGGPLASLGLELDCFLCHLPGADNSQRLAELKAGRYSWAATATLVGTGLVSREGEGYMYAKELFNADGSVGWERLRVSDPPAANCGFCHGVVAEGEAPVSLPPGLAGWPAPAMGRVFSAQRVKHSALNLQGKEELNRTWDVHAARLMSCVDCHCSVNNPAYAGKTADEPSLQYDARRATYGGYLNRPDHNLARGGSSTSELAPPTVPMRSCVDCHDPLKAHAWLPRRAQHMAALSCEACHIPCVLTPTLTQVDWTMLTPAGEPLLSYRGVDGPAGDPRSLITGCEPLLLPVAVDSQREVLAPFTALTLSYWVTGTTGQRVSAADLRQALFAGAHYRPEIVAALDRNHDGTLGEDELRLDTPERAAVVGRALAAVGVDKPRIASEVQRFALHHGIVAGTYSLRDCSTCHAPRSRLSAPFLLAQYLPGGVAPDVPWAKSPAQRLAIRPATGAGCEYRLPAPALGAYVPGHSRWPMVDGMGLLLILAVAVAALVHGSLRLYAARRRARGAGRVRT